MSLRKFCVLAAMTLYICIPIQGITQNQDSVESSIQKKLDPTDFRSRLEFRNEYQRTHVDGSRNLILPRFDYAMSKELAFRVELPFVSETAMGTTASSGIGDLLGRVVYRAARGPGYAWVVGSELTLDTADRALGAGTNVGTLLTFMSIDLPDYKSVLFPNYQYGFNIGGGRRISLSTLRSSVLTRWPERFYSFVEPTLYVDHERGSRAAGTLEVEIGRFISSEVAIWARPGIGISRGVLPQVYDWNFEVGFRYFLK